MFPPDIREALANSYEVAAAQGDQASIQLLEQQKRSNAVSTLMQSIIAVFETSDLKERTAWKNRRVQILRDKSNDLTKAVAQVFTIAQHGPASDFIREVPFEKIFVQTSTVQTRVPLLQRCSTEEELRDFAKKIESASSCIEILEQVENPVLILHTAS